MDKNKDRDDKEEIELMAAVDNKRREFMGSKSLGADDCYKDFSSVIPDNYN